MGFIQGITEFLPVSSSTHLILAEYLLNFKQPEIFLNLFLHLATLCVVIIYFRSICMDLLKCPLDLFKKEITPSVKLLILIIVATIPTALMGYFGQSYFDSLFEHLRFSGITLIVNGLLLILSTPLFKNPQNTDDNLFHIGFSSKILLKAFMIGIFQGIAIIPGISRLGMTMISATYLGFSPLQSFNFSFLISIPTIIGAFILHMAPLTNTAFVPLTLAFILCLIAGFISISFLKSLITKGYFPFFGYYCIILGIIVFSFL